MLSVLIVTPLGQAAVSVAARHPFVEILRAHGVEDAIEKLGRNRRVDAVLLAAGAENGEIARAIREDNPATAPLFEAGGDSLEADLDRLILALQG